MRDYTDEMSDGAKLGAATVLIAAGGFLAWWMGKPAMKTAGGPGFGTQQATFPGMGMRPSGSAVAHDDYQQGYAAGQHAWQLSKWEYVANPGSVHAELLTQWESQTMPQGRSQAWQNGWRAGVHAAWMADWKVALDEGLKAAYAGALNQPHAATGTRFTTAPAKHTMPAGLTGSAAANWQASYVIGEMAGLAACGSWKGSTPMYEEHVPIPSLHSNTPGLAQAPQPYLNAPDQGAMHVGWVDGWNSCASANFAPHFR